MSLQERLIDWPVEYWVHLREEMTADERLELLWERWYSPCDICGASCEGEPTEPSANGGRQHLYCVARRDASLNGTGSSIHAPYKGNEVPRRIVDGDYTGHDGHKRNNPYCVAARLSAGFSMMDDDYPRMK